MLWFTFLLALGLSGLAARAEQKTVEELLATADERIAQHRQGEATVVVVDADGKPVEGATVAVEQVRHAFLFGCNVFGLGQFPTEALNRAYAERFAALLNYATLPFYWGAFERQEGQPNYEGLEKMARWCAEHHITTKGHPLVWHEVVPAWAPKDLEVLEARLSRRVHDLVGRFQGLIDVWDVINEATVSAGQDNPVGHWVKAQTPAYCVGQSLAWAREANPQATLLVNDFNVSRSYEALLETLQAEGRPVDAIGIQSHMHKGTWPLERVWQVCETYARFGLPIHFTETTVLSGPLKTDNDWQRHRSDWNTTPEGEQQQAEYVEKFYRLLFSHPAMAAITWWDFSDAAAWQGAPAGFLRKDMTPKPVYDRLLEMIKSEWWTRTEGRTNAAGQFQFRGFYGQYTLTVRHGDKEARLEAALEKGGANEFRVTLK
jgi:GH35 family endo-1,4-beta-xylanase